MSENRRARIFGALILIAAYLFFTLGFHRRAKYVRNFEEGEYGKGQAFVEPISVSDGLAVYSVGEGEPVLLFPYPHAHTKEPMAQGPIANLLLKSGRKVITFDVPGAYRSTREPVGDMDEMLQSANETLDRLGIQAPVDVVGHSMGGLSALAFAIERPERTRKLVLANSLSGFPASARWGFPGSAFHPLEPDYWRIIFWGMRVGSGRGDLALHKRLQNLMNRVSYFDETRFTPLPIEADDHQKGIPIRMIWNRNMYRRLSYEDQLGQVQAPTLVLGGRHDPATPLACSNELFEGISGATLLVFEQSGHFPFFEEPELFVDAVSAFLNGEHESISQTEP